MDPVRKITSYFNLMDGNPKNYEDSVKAIVEDLYDPDVKMAGIEDEEIGYERIIDAIKEFCEDGVRVELNKIERTDTGLDYEISVFYPDGVSFHPKTRATVVNGKIIRVDPLDPSAIEKLIEEKDL